MNKPKLWEEELQYRRTILRVLLIVIILFCTLASNSHFKTGNLYYGILEVALVGMAIGLLFIHQKTPHLTRWSAVLLFFCFNTILIGIVIQTTRSFLFNWLCFIPVLSYLLMGLRTGFVFSFIYLMTGMGLLIWRLYLPVPDVTKNALINLGSCAASIWAMSHVFESKRASMVGRLQKLAETDSLTGLHNRLHLDSIFQQLTKGQRGQPTLIAMLLLDLDKFKTINDNYGHDAGDQVLMTVSTLMTDICRGGDWAFRFGGEEFCLLVPGVSSEMAIQIAERLRESIAATVVNVDEHQLRVTASIGVANWPKDGAGLSQLYKVADQRLYTAKNSGRNRVMGSDYIRSN
ncbi:GGDEF domain-containing protein [Undibacterium sp. Ji67W]|uniref:GGDEF domain-containing protein n=1 Tax=Undibacterium sp. Ji67W TaxID=3413042 RepID=UPI003BF10F13